MKSNSQLYIALLLLWIGIHIFSIYGNGYGVEEDSLTAAYTAYEIYSTGEYHISRLPGHPVFEILLGSTWPIRQLMWPIFIGLGVFLTAIFGRQIVERHGVEKRISFLFLGIIFLPVMQFTLGETMEYSLALGTMVAAWNYSQRGNWWASAIFLALSTGLRIPNLIFGLPLFLILLQKRNAQSGLLFGILTFALSIAIYIPVYQIFGLEFFSTYELPYPPLLKILYKGTVGVWGILGLIGLGIALFGVQWKRVFKLINLEFFAYVLAFIFSIGLFIGLPEKSAFLLPFAVLLGGFTLRFSRPKYLKIGFTILLLNPFLLGTDLVDEYRGIPEEEVDISIPAGGQTMGIQLFLPNPAAKMENKQQTVLKLIAEMNNIENEAFIVTGWWYPFLQMAHFEYPLDRIPNNIEYVYYADENQIITALREGKSIFFTPEAEIFNVQRYGHDLLSRYGKPLINTEP